MSKLLRTPLLTLPIDAYQQLPKACARLLEIPEDAILECVCVKKSLDKRHKTPKFQMIFDLVIRNSVQSSKLEACLPPPSHPELPFKDFRGDTSKKVALIGCGPTTLFAALTLVDAGLKPHIFERGKPVRERTQDIAKLLHHGVLDPESNVCFGEGGAGTFSDGKLFTRTKSPYLFHILERFHDFGAPDDILFDAHPHIGTDRLANILPKIRTYLMEHGAQFHFQTYVNDLDIRDGICRGVMVDGESIYFDDVILACGHSEAVLPQRLLERGVAIEPKPLAIGVRIEHPQALINEIQYGVYATHPALPPADYALTFNDVQKQLPSVYSFCMCPGGRVIPAMTQDNTAVVNGMSPSARNGKFANSAIIAQLDTSYFAPNNPLGGFHFLHELERKAARRCARAQAPAQNLLDYLQGKTTSQATKTTYRPSTVSDDFNQILPSKLNQALHKAFDTFNQKMRGFKTKNANLIGLETRTSSPIQITRSPITYEAIQTAHLFPAGEGAGYAGGITSCALDGYNVALALLQRYA